MCVCECVRVIPTLLFDHSYKQFLRISSWSFLGCCGELSWKAATGGFCKESLSPQDTDPASQSLCDSEPAHELWAQSLPCAVCWNTECRNYTLSTEWAPVFWLELGGPPDAPVDAACLVSCHGAA